VEEAPDPVDRAGFLLFFACGIVHLPGLAERRERSMVAAAVDHRLAR